MKSVKKVERLLQVHHSLLKMREWEQKKSADAVQEADLALRAINDSLQEAEETSHGGRLTAQEIVMWNLYLGYLGAQHEAQQNVLNERKEVLEHRRAETIVAYQEQEKWRIQKDRLQAEITKETSAREIKEADELAIQKYAETRQIEQ